MEQRLIRQRNAMFLKITLILAAVWLIVSAVFCTIFLYNESSRIETNEIARLSAIKNLLTDGYEDESGINYIFLNLTDYSDPEPKFDCQYIFIDKETRETVLDTANKIAVRYGVQVSADRMTTMFGLLDYYMVRDALTDDEFARIKELLTTPRSDGKECELVFSKFILPFNAEVIPVELQVVAVAGEDELASNDEVLETYELEENGEGIDKEYVLTGNPMRRNIIPKSFILDGQYNHDYISTLTRAQKDRTVDVSTTGFLKYILYLTDNMVLYTKDESLRGYYQIRYAKEVDLLDSAKKPLIIGVSGIFLFFLAIGLIICLMIGKMVRSQIIQEQRRTDVTNALAHDIKTPLFVISGYAYSLKEGIDGDERDSYLDKIIEQSDEINRLVHKMLELSKLDSYTMELHRSEFDLAGLVSERAADLTALPDGKSVEFTHSGDSMISADRELVKTALHNVTDNAVKYALPNSVIKIIVSGRTLTVRNESEELSASELKKLWQPYTRRDKSRHKEGNGLGLSIVRSIMELHGAKYGIKQENGEFVFTAEFTAVK